MNDKVNIGVIGAGWWAALGHIPALRDNPHVGIVAVNQPSEQPPPTCGTLQKQGTPHISYFVVDRNSSKGRRSLDESLAAFTQIAKNP